MNRCYKGNHLKNGEQERTLGNRLVVAPATAFSGMILAEDLVPPQLTRRRTTR